MRGKQTPLGFERRVMMVTTSLRPFCPPHSSSHWRPTLVRSVATTSVALPVNSFPLKTIPKKVLVPMGLGVEEMEVVIMVDVLRRAGTEVTLASVEPQLQIKASSGMNLVADAFITSCQHEVFDLVALPGGMPGSARLRDCRILEEMTRRQADEQRLYGAISTAPAIALEPWGLLKKSKMTGHPAFMDKLPTFRAVKSNVQVSGGLTTSRGPGTAIEFALCFVEQLLCKETAEEVRETLGGYNDGLQQRTKEYNQLQWPFSHIPRALVPIANGSEEVETVVVVDILRRANVDVVVASVEKSKQILASRNNKIIADKFIGDAADLVYDIVILPGSCRKAERLYKSRILKKLLKEHFSAGRVLGEICSTGDLVLQKHGLLMDRKVAMQPGSSGLSGEVGAGVVIDRNLITSRGAGNAIDFALAIVGKLFGHGRARSVAEGIVFDYSPCQVSEEKRPTHL